MVWDMRLRICAFRKRVCEIVPSLYSVSICLQVDTIKVAEAKAAILWVIGEYSDRIPKIAPDVLRKMAKNFTSEEVMVKLQILNLAAKLCLVNPKQTKLLAQYVFSLAKYDQNYDIRDQVPINHFIVLQPTV
jgi:AP-3 complex subunit beta